MSPEQLSGMRGNIEQAVFDRMTRGVDEQEAQGQQSFEQEMHNRGIPFSDDPNSQYQRRQEAHNRKFDDIREGARQQAVQMGGAEMQRQFGMGLQGHQQDVSDATSFQGWGTGLTMPNFQGFSAGQYAPTDPFEWWATQKGLKQQGRQIRQQGQLTQAQVNELNARAGLHGANAAAAGNASGGEEYYEL